MCVELCDFIAKILDHKELLEKAVHVANAAWIDEPHEAMLTIAGIGDRPFIVLSPKGNIMHFYEIFHDLALNIVVHRTKHDFRDDVEEVSHDVMFLPSIKIFVVFEHSEALVQNKVNYLRCLLFRHFVEQSPQ